MVSNFRPLRLWISNCGWALQNITDDRELSKLKVSAMHTPVPGVTRVIRRDVHTFRGLRPQLPFDKINAGQGPNLGRGDVWQALGIRPCVGPSPTERLQDEVNRVVPKRK